MQVSWVQRFSFGTVLYAIASALAACGVTFEFPIDDPAPEQPPLVEPLPVVIGVYYSPELRNYEHRSTCKIDWEEIAYNYRLGPASIAIFDYALAGMFQKVVAIEAWPPQSAETQPVYAVIQPAVESVVLPTPFSDCGSRTARITYRVTLYSPEGEHLASWKVSGQAASGLEMPVDWQGKKKLRRAVNDALRDAAANFIIGFRDSARDSGLDSESYGQIR